MRLLDDRPRTRIAVRLVVLAVATVLLVRWACAAVPAEKVSPDFICFWSAAELLASGQNPYDPALQTEVQRRCGWDKATDGIGLYDCLPYFYPPWFAMLVVPLLPLGYSAAKVAWFVLNVELLALAGYLLRDTVPGLPRSVPVVFCCAFALSVFAVLMGQTPPLLLFLVAALWRLLEKGHDRWAGFLLCWLAIKPQITAILVLALLVWAIRHRRWGLLQGLIGTTAALSLASALIVPAWPVHMLGATGRTPLPTSYFPWYGTTWLLALKSFGLRSWGLAAAYLLLALPLLAAVARVVLGRVSSLSHLFALSLLAAFFVAPYGQPYDFAVLVVPALVLMGERLSERQRTVFLVAMLIVPYLHIMNAKQVTLWWLPAKPAHQVTLFWIPLLLAGTWLMTTRRSLPATYGPGLLPVAHDHALVHAEPGGAG